MGMSCLRMMETMATLKVLAEENLQTLKKDTWKEIDDTLQMGDRIDQINKLIKTMNHDWDHIPNEWSAEKKQWTK